MSGASQSRSPNFIRLDGRTTSFVIDCRGPGPAFVYSGSQLAADCDLDLLTRLQEKPEAPASPARPPAITLTPLLGAGFSGRPGLSAHREGKAWATWTRIAEVRRPGPGAVEIESIDEANGICLIHRVTLARDGDVLRARTSLINRGGAILTVDACDAPTLPIPAAVSHWTMFEGRWAGEFHTRRIERAMGAVSRENRRGRTSHDAYPAILAEVGPCTEQAGELFGLHLAWSGNHRLWAETLVNGRAYVQLGELFMPGEMRLEPGARYDSPELVCGWSDQGRNGLSRAFHNHLRARPQHARLRVKPRPVHYNTWEAVYFNHQPKVLHDLAGQAAAIGAERFVLDDGWFKARRDDRAGLGDWTVDRDVYPDGLGPLIDHVRGLGMEFGLWVEPEMVNPDSDFYRVHPDWVLGAPPAPQLDFRHQLVLDFSRAEVREHIVSAITALLTEHPIAYLKWDMNRDISHPGGAVGSAAAHAHVLGLYAVLDQLRQAHPAVEIESCASGGGRADFAILDRTDRVWTSDSNDALDRLSIQRGFSAFIPAELMGSHVGPSPCHITGRRVSMGARVATAFFGHFGVEADLRALSEAERDQLAAGIALHKAHRALIHSGDLVRLDRPAGEVAFGIVAVDGSEALFSHTQVSEPPEAFAAPLRLSGLAPGGDYRVEQIWPAPDGAAPALFAEMGEIFSAPADLLMSVGLQLARRKPQQAFILHLTRVGPANEFS
ncbi:alpha-galactosidase [soil metagenome]